MTKITRKQWDRTSEDYKGVRNDGMCSMLAYDPQHGTILVPVEVVEHVEPADCDHLWLRFREDWSGVGHGRAPQVYAVCDTCGATGPSAAGIEAARAALLTLHPPASAGENASERQVNA